MVDPGTALAVAGLVTSVTLPLLVEVIKGFDRLVDPWKTFLKSSKVLKNFRDELQSKRTVFANDCAFLLLLTATKQEVRDMMRDPVHSLWGILQEDPARKRAIERSVAQFTAQGTLQDINYQLQCILSELNKLGEAIKGGLADLSASRSSIENGSVMGRSFSAEGSELCPSLQLVEMSTAWIREPDVTSAPLWYRKIPARLSLVFKKPDLQNGLRALGKHITRLNQGINQIERNRGLASNPPGSHDESHPDVDKQLAKAETMRLASQNLYQELGGLWSCREHPEHTANLRLRHEAAESEASEDAVSICFNIAVTFQNADRDVGVSPQALELSIETLCGEPSSSVSERSSGNPQGSARTSRVRFDTGSGPDRARPSISSVATLPDAIAKNLCQSFRDLSDPSRAALSLDRFPGMRLGTHLVRDPDRERSMLGAAIDLGRWATQQPKAVRIRRREKLEMAGALAMAVLQYHSTPWLPPHWKSTNVLLFEKHQRSSHASTRLPHLQLLGLVPRPTSAEATRRCRPGIRNQTLFCLGIILLELEFEETIENLLQGLQLSEDAAVGNSMLWDRIEDLKGDAGASLGDAYGRIVRQCLDCDFGTGSPDLSLDDRALRRKYYLDVIERLRTMITLDRRMEDLDRALPEMRI